MITPCVRTDYRICTLLDGKEYRRTELNALPDELFLYIFSFLRNPSDLDTCYLVSKKWSSLASDKLLWEKIDLPNLTILPHTDLAHVDKRILFRRLKNFLKIPIRYNAGVTLFRFEKSTLNQIKKENAHLFRYVSPPILKKFGKVCMESCFVAITNDVVEGTKWLLVDEQIKVLKEKYRCQVAGLLPSITFFMHNEKEWVGGREGIRLAEVYDNHVINFLCWEERLELIATRQKRREDFPSTRTFGEWGVLGCLIIKTFDEEAYA